LGVAAIDDYFLIAADSSGEGLDDWFDPQHFVRCRLLHV
jgi:hypothetical protein